MSSFNVNPFNFQPDIYIFPEEFGEEFRIKLTQYLNDIAVSLNSKENGFYFQDEIPTARQFIPLFSTSTAQNAQYRPVYRTVVDFGSLPNTAAKSVVHGLTTTENYSLVNLYGGATDPGASDMTSGIPLPFSSPILANNIALEMDNTNIVVTTGSNRSAYTQTFVVIEYIKEN